MHVDFKTHAGTVGKVTLSADGVAVPSNQGAEETMRDTVIVWPGEPPEIVKPEEGEKYLRALAVCLRGSYFWAELVE